MNDISGALIGGLMMAVFHMTIWFIAVYAARKVTPDMSDEEFWNVMNEGMARLPLWMQL